MADISEKHLSHFAHLAHKWRGKWEAHHEKWGERIGRGVRTLEVGAAAFTAGVIDGRFDKGDGAPTIMHVPLTLGVGVGLMAAGFANVAGKDWSPHLNNFADGFIANYAAAKGHKFGTDWLSNGRLFGPPKTAPGLPGVVAHGMPDPAQMAQAVANMQQAVGVPR